MTFPPSTISSPHASMSTTSPSICIPPSTPPTMFLSPIVYQPRPHHLVVDIVTSIQWTLDSQSWTGQKLCLLKSSPSYGTSIPKAPKGLFLCLFSDFESLLMICFRRLELVLMIGRPVGSTRVSDGEILNVSPHSNRYFLCNLIPVCLLTGCMNF